MQLLSDIHISRDHRPVSFGELKARPSRLWAEARLHHGRRARFGELEFAGQDLGRRADVDVF